MSTDIGTTNEIVRMADAIAKAGLFGVRTSTQALAYMLATSTASMLHDYLSVGGEIEWHELTDIHAKATFSLPRGGSITLEWDTP